MNVKSLITLDDGNEYVIVSKVIYDGITYLYLVDIHNHSNIKYCIEKKDELGFLLSEVEDPELIKKLSIEFYKSSKDLIKEVLKMYKENAE